MLGGSLHAFLVRAPPAAGAEADAEQAKADAEEQANCVGAVHSYPEIPLGDEPVGGDEAVAIVEAAAAAGVTLDVFVGAKRGFVADDEHDAESEDPPIWSPGPSPGCWGARVQESCTLGRGQGGQMGGSSLSASCSSSAAKPLFAPTKTSRVTPAAAAASAIATASSPPTGSSPRGISG